MSNDEELGDIRSEYDFSGGQRGKYSASFGKDTNVLILDPDLLDVFPDAESAGKALRALAELIRAQRRDAV